MMVLMPLKTIIIMHIHSRLLALVRCIRPSYNFPLSSIVTIHLSKVRSQRF